MELLQVADTVAREKNIDREIVIGAMEEAIQKAGRSKYGHDHDIRAEIDRKSGDITLKRYREVVEDPELIENEIAQLTVPQAQRIKKDAVAGEFLIDDLPPLDFGRIAAQTAKQVIMQKVREAERARQYEEYKDRVGEIINGVVKRVEYGNATIDIAGRADGLLRRDESIPREHLNNNERVRAIIYEVREEQRGPQIFLSRSHPEFMAKLFTQEVPEIYDGVIEIKSVARDPGSRAKIVVVPDEQLSLAIGRRGQNVRLASILTGWDIDIMTEAEESERRAEEFKVRSTLFMEAMDVDDVIAHLLVAEGFTTVEEIVETPIDELNQIEGFEEEVSIELQNRAIAFLEGKAKELEDSRQKLGIADDLMSLEGISPFHVCVLYALLIG